MKRGRGKSVLKEQKKGLRHKYLKNQIEKEIEIEFGGFFRKYIQSEVNFIFCYYLVYIFSLALLLYLHLTFIIL